MRPPEGPEERTARQEARSRAKRLERLTGKGDAWAETLDLRDTGASPATTEPTTKRSNKEKKVVIQCYERRLRQNPRLSGSIILRFTIGSSGDVKKAEVAEDTMEDPEVTTCIIDAVKSWQFPAPSGGEDQFLYPFVFQSAR